MRSNVLADVWRFVDRKNEAECWEWTGARSDNGYGSLKVQGRSLLAHRVTYELTLGPLPAELQIDHLCRNKGCVNPKHLELVTAQENSRRANWTDTCKNGHPRSPENTYVWRGTRICRPCRRVTTLAYYHRTKVSR